MKAEQFAINDHLILQSEEILRMELQRDREAIEAHQALGNTDDHP